MSNARIEWALASLGESLMTLSVALVALALLQKTTEPPPPLQNLNPAPDGPVVALETTMGTIKIGLYQTKAPISTENFLRYVSEGFYDGTIFHRVIPGFMVQAGGFTPDMKEKPGRPPIRNEARNLLRNVPGAVAMARTGDPNSATSQFYISVKHNHSLDFGIAGAGYAVFGMVLEGMDVVERITTVSTGVRGQFEDVPNTPVVIKSARVVAAPAAPPPPGAGH
jgi:cyclophilin family peptidyl-prolyl cis-trans isomerase